MHDDLQLIETVAIGLSLAFLAGFVAARLKLSPLVGYLLAGIAIGPHTPGFVGNIKLTEGLAEIGVMLLMFGVGIHFSPRDLLEVRKIAISGAILQIVVTTSLGAGAALFWGWTPMAAVLFGLALSVASTVVMLRAFEGRGAMESVDGRIAIGWLIVEDLAMVLALVLLPALAGQGTGNWGDFALSVGLTLGKVALFVVGMMVVGRRVVPWLLSEVAKTGSRELFTLAMLAVAIGIAFGSKELFNVSFALGAFFAGVVIHESDLSHRAAESALPLQDAFAVIFFLSVGMLFEPSILVEAPLKVLAVVAIIMLAKPLGAVVLVLFFRYPPATALTVGGGLGQIGEFSFILAALGIGLGLLPAEGRNLILAGAIISITLNPFLFQLTDALGRWAGRNQRVEALLDREEEDELLELPVGFDASQLLDHAVIVGYGRVGQRIAQTLSAGGVPFVVIDTIREVVAALRGEGVPALWGDGTNAEILNHAGIERAAILAVAVPDPFLAREVVARSRELRPGIPTVARTHSDAEYAYLVEQGVGLVVMGERELAARMASEILAQVGAEGARARAEGKVGA